MLWAMPSGIYVIGSVALDEVNLMTASLVVQVATQPKLVAVAIDVSARTHALVARGGCFSVNIMSRED
ncbi:MAG: flavin reductase, partial [Gaiellaceae bacterium]